MDSTNTNPGDTSSANALGAKVLLHKVEDPATDLRGLLAVWQLYQGKAEAWHRLSIPLRALAERLLGLGAIGTALEVLAAGLHELTGDLRLRQLQGLAWARGGDLPLAERALTALYGEGHTDEETLGILGGVRKQMGLASADPAVRQQRLTAAMNVYAHAYREHHSCWTGINAATLAVLLDDTARAAQIAEEVRRQCLAEIETLGGGGDRYWAVATLGEAALVVRDLTAAAARYAEAARLAGARFGHLRSTREQARLLLAHYQLPLSLADVWLPMPKVIAFVGHMIDQEGRPVPRFPPALEEPVRSAIQDALARIGARIGFSSAACGADLLFQEAMGEHGGECHVVLPYEEKQFVADCVAYPRIGGWINRFALALDRAAQVEIASPGRIAGGGLAYAYASLLIEGFARSRAAQLGAELQGLVVWDGQPGDGPGGTDDALTRWRRADLPVTVINIDALRRGEAWDRPVVSLLPTPPRVADDGGPETRIMAVLFADVEGYSQLTDVEIARFVEHFLGGVAMLLRRHASAIADQNTWGDALYIVFPEVRDAGILALELCDWMQAIDWNARGLPSLSLRIALHAGPVFAFTDPIRGRSTYTGSHVSCCARLEPITQPGQVYATQAFDALVRCQRITEFTCRLVERKEWPKSYGSYPVHLVQWAEGTNPQTLAIGEIQNS
jgi:class 3 adenylate cyclase